MEPENNSAPSGDPTRNTLDAKVSVFRNAFAEADTPPQGNRTLRTVLENIRSGFWATQVAHVRKTLAEQGIEAYRKAKKLLPCFITAGVFSGRCNAGLLIYSGCLVLDYDHVKDLRALLARIVADPHVVFVFISPSGEGLKVGVRVPMCSTDAEHKIAWHAAVAYGRKQWGESAAEDKGCKDVSRLCFVSHDPELHVNESVRELDCGEPKPETAAAKSGKNEPRKASETTDDRSNALAALARLGSWRADDYITWIQVGMALKSVSPDLLPEWEQWSRQSTKFKEGECAEKWQSFKRDDLTLGSLIHWAHIDDPIGSGSCAPSQSLPPGIEIIATRATPRKATVAVRRDGAIVLFDTATIGAEKDREKLARKIADATGAPLKAVELNLLEHATRLASGPEEPQQILNVSEHALKTLDAAIEKALAGTPEDVVSAARSMLLNPRLLDIVVADAQAIGIAGEENLIAGLYTTFTSRLLAEPVHPTVQGTSSSGKSYICNKVAELIPPESVFAATDITPNALYYLPPGALVHRLVVAGEKSRIQDDAAAEASRALREMKSAGKLSKAVAMKTGRGIESVRIEQPGPIVHCESTTLVDLFDEDANRCVLLAADESAPQTDLVLGKLASRAKGEAADSAPIVAKHHAAQRMLKRVNVVVPFADKLAASLPRHLPHVRRAFGQLLEVTKASALAHQYQRAEGPLEHGDTIEAILHDYGIARRILLRPLARALGKALPDAVLRFGKWLLLWAEQKSGHAGHGDLGPSFTNADLGKEPGIPIPSRSKRSEYLGKLRDIGFLSVVGTEGKANRYQIMVREVPDADASKWLPTVESLAATTDEKKALAAQAGNTGTLPENPRHADIPVFPTPSGTSREHGDKVAGVPDVPKVFPSPPGTETPLYGNDGGQCPHVPEGEANQDSSPASTITAGGRVVPPGEARRIKWMPSEDYWAGVRANAESR